MEALENIWNLVGKPDNVPILGMLILVIFFTVLIVVLGRRNDRLRSKTGSESDAEALKEAKKHGVVWVRDVLYPEAEQPIPRKVSTWPHLVKLEMLAVLFVTAGLLIWSITIDAPLEEPSNPGLSPNPAKAPWYFLGLQDMLVYFDPWIAGVAIPSLIIFGLMAIPYIDTNPKGNGYYTLRERKFALVNFFFGFVLLWVFFIIIGTFLRGPGWIWFWPWEKWDAHRVVAETNINLNEFLANGLGIPALNAPRAGMYVGAVAIIGYYLLGFSVPYLILKWRGSPWLMNRGRVRYGIIAFLFWSMMGLPMKVVLRLLFSIKYVWTTPWFNI